MSSRERWIVYPLLLLALGTALRPKFVTPETVVGHRLVILDQENRQRIVLGMSERTSEAEIDVLSREGRSVATMGLDPQSRAGLIETRTMKGEPQAMLTSSDTGGEIIAYEAERQAVGIGHRGGRSGLSITDLKSRKALFVPFSDLLR